MANFSNWEITHTNPEKTHLHKKFERPPDSVAELTDDTIFCRKPVHKD